MSDCISREAVLEHYRVTDQAGTFAYCDSILDFVSSLPAADVKPVVRGYWWTYPDEDTDCNGNLLVWCSECDAEDHQVPGKKVPFCWHCGADMSDEVKRLWEPPNCGADMRERDNEHE